MRYKVSRASNNDLPLMQRFFYQTVMAHGAAIFTKEEILRYSRLAANKRYWRQKFINDFVYNAKLNGEIVGSFLLNRNGTIGYIFVHQDYQRKGIAKALYNALEKVARDAGMVELRTEINMATKSFFQKNGYTITKEIKPSKNGEILIFCGVKKISEI